MKKLLFLLMALLAFSFLVPAQGQNEEEPIESLTLKKGNIPAPVLKSAEELFKGNTQVAWGSFPYELKEFGWSVNNEYNEPIDHYEIKFKATDGSDIFAIFESTGELIKCKIVNKNAPVPKAIILAVQKSEYKDWKIIGDVMQIKSSQNKVDEHFAVKIAKDKMKKTLIYSPKGDLMTVK
jgi:hypothetical protein